MVQVLINILNNAIKYTKENDRIDIQVRNIDRQVQFTIKDEGKGISEKIVDHILKNL